jgi:hypothetical protein
MKMPPIVGLGLLLAATGMMGCASALESPTPECDLRVTLRGVCWARGQDRGSGPPLTATQVRQLTRKEELRQH